jgi:hypothetical protein
VVVAAVAVVGRFDMASRVAIVVVGVDRLGGAGTTNAADDEAARAASRAESLYFGMVLLPQSVRRL